MIYINWESRGLQVGDKVRLLTLQEMRDNDFIPTNRIEPTHGWNYSMRESSGKICTIEFINNAGTITFTDFWDGWSWHIDMVIKIKGKGRPKKPIVLTKIKKNSKDFKKLLDNFIKNSDDESCSFKDYLKKKKYIIS